VWFKDELLGKFKPHSSPVDWCEKNYTVTPNVAEFWNSLSSCFMVIPPLVAWIGHSGSKMEKYEPNLRILWVCMLLIGIGSVYFHADLSVAGQVLDELPIIILAIM